MAQNDHCIVDAPLNPNKQTNKDSEPFGRGRSVVVYYSLPRTLNFGAEAFSRRVNGIWEPETIKIFSTNMIENDGVTAHKRVR